MQIKTLKDFNRNRRITLKIISADPLIKLKKYAEAFTSLGASIDKNGFPVTGLTEDWTTEGPKGGKITHRGTRERREKLLDLEAGTLKQSAKFWVTYTIRLDSDEMVLDLNSPHDLLKFLFASAQSIVANSLKEIDTNSKAEFVLFSPEQEAKVQVRKRSHLKQAYVLADSLDLETKINLLNVFGISVDATEISTIENKIDEKVEENPQAFLLMAKDELLVIKSLLTRALQAGVLDLDGGAVMHGESILGYDRDSAAAALAKDTKLQIIIKAKISGDLALIKEALKTD